MSRSINQTLNNNKGGAAVKPITGRQVFWGLAIFFGVIFAMNGVFMYYAISTHTGIDSSNSYRRGLNYNTRVRAEARQLALGWTPVLALNSRADQVTLTISARHDLPVPNLVITGVLNRPATSDFDRKLVLQEISPGRYVANFKPLPPGNWIISLRAADPRKPGDNIVYRLRKRLWQKPPK